MTRNSERRQTRECEFRLYITTFQQNSTTSCSPDDHEQKLALGTELKQRALLKQRILKQDLLIRSYLLKEKKRLLEESRTRLSSPSVARILNRGKLHQRVVCQRSCCSLQQGFPSSCTTSEDDQSNERPQKSFSLPTVPNLGRGSKVSNVTVNHRLHTKPKLPSLPWSWSSLNTKKKKGDPAATTCLET